MEKCVFCGNTRKTAPLVRFFAVPREPGLKRIQWLYALGDKEMGPKDRVCGLHFRQGRPSSDPSHEDFVPHLYLNREPPEEILHYLESLDDSKPNTSASVSISGLNSVGVLAAASTLPGINANNENNTGGNVPKLKVEQRTPPRTDKFTKGQKPSILQRKRKQKLPSDTEDEHPNLIEKCWNGEGPSPSKVHILHRSVAEAVGAKHGQSVIVRRIVPIIRKQKKFVSLDIGADALAEDNALHDASIAATTQFQQS